MTKNERMPELPPTVEQEIAEKNAIKKARLDRGSGSQAFHFRQVDLEHEAFVLPEWPHEEQFARLKRGIGHTMLDIFLHIVSQDVLKAIWVAIDDTDWYFKDGMLFGGAFLPKPLYIYFAIYFRLIGHHQMYEGHQRPLRDAIAEALSHFTSLAGGRTFPKQNTFEKLFPRFHIGYELFGMINEQFQDCINHIGRVLCGDEKLSHFTGTSGFIELVPSKPDRVGLWFYEACCTLVNKKPYLVYGKLSPSSSKVDLKSPVSDIVQDWAQICLDNRGKVPNCTPIVVFDSYYISKETRKFLNDHQIGFIGSVALEESENLRDNLAQHGHQVLKQGDTAAIFCEETSEVFVHHWNLDSQVGKKYVLSNTPRRVRNVAGTIPANQHYCKLFNACDKYNKGFKKRSLPFYSGGNGTSGESGRVHKFIVACIVQNVVNLYESNLPLDAPHKKFYERILELSDDLFEYAMSL